MMPYLEGFKEHIGRIRLILKEAQELPEYPELQSAAQKQYNKRDYARKQTRNGGVLGVDTMQLLEDEFTFIKDLQYANRVKLNELTIEMARTTIVKHEMLRGCARHSRPNGSDEMGGESNAGKMRVSR